MQNCPEFVFCSSLVGCYAVASELCHLVLLSAVYVVLCWCPRFVLYCCILGLYFFYCCQGYRAFKGCVVIQDRIVFYYYLEGVTLCYVAFLGLGCFPVQKFFCVVQRLYFVMFSIHCSCCDVLGFILLEMCCITVREQRCSPDTDVVFCRIVLYCYPYCALFSPVVMGVLGHHNERRKRRQWWVKMLFLVPVAGVLRFAVCSSCDCSHLCKLECLYIKKLRNTGYS